MHFKHKMAMAVVVALATAAATPVVDAAPRARPMPGHHANQGLQDTADGGTCDPFADWDWQYDGASNSNTGDTLRAASGWSASARTAATDAAARVIGTTPEAIERNFVGVVTRNLANAGTAGRIARLSDRELEGIARHAAQGAPAERAALLKVFATRLDSASLVRVARAFGRAPVEAAVGAYADPATHAAFTTAAAGVALLPPGSGGGGSYPRPTFDMTLEEIYLEFRTAPVGSLSSSAALAETAIYAGSALYLSYKSGQWVGSKMHQLIETYDPTLDETLGDIVGSMIENFWLATSEAEQGHYEAAFDDLFGFPVTWSSDPFGDWDITTPMVDYYQTSGSCGF